MPKYRRKPDVIEACGQMTKERPHGRCRTLATIVLRHKASRINTLAIIGVVRCSSLANYPILRRDRLPSYWNATWYKIS